MFWEEDEELWKRQAHEWGEAAAEVGVTFVVSHSPLVNAFGKLDEETYRTSLRAVRRSVEICHVLGIPRIVVHANQNPLFTAREFACRISGFIRISLI